MRVLVCEDDDRVARGLTRALTREGYQVARTAGVKDALAEIARAVPQIALIDMTLPDGHGSEVVRRLRDEPGTAILIVTAHGEEHERVIGLRAGADDYVVKPFSLAELLARIEAVARRTRHLRQQIAPNTPTISLADAVTYDRDTRELRTPDGAVTLTSTENDILALLVEHRGHVVPREHILDQVWNSVSPSHSRALDTHMASLRGKIGARSVIRTVRGVGYVLESAD